MPARPLKIGYLITRMDRGGAPEILMNLFEGMREHGHIPRLICGPSRDPSERARRFLSRVETREIPTLCRDIHPWKDRITYCALTEMFRKEKFDILHTHTSKAGYLGRMAAAKTGMRNVVHTPHGHTLYGYFNPLVSAGVTLLERQAAAHCRALIALTEREKEEMVRAGIAPEKKIRVIYQGLRWTPPDISRAHALRQERGISPDAPVITMAGRLERIKGPEYFIEAAVKMLPDHPAAHFLLAGEGPLRARLEKISRRNDLFRTHVHFLGWREDIPEVLAASDILVCPSLNEAVGIAAVHAMSLGKPVIASEVGGLPEILGKGSCGILVPPRDTAALCSAIHTLLADKTLRETFGSAGKKQAEERFAIEHMISATGALYEESTGLGIDIP